MKRQSIVFFLMFCLFASCKKDQVDAPEASFNFRGDNVEILKIGTYDTCTLINSSVNTDSSFWDLGNGKILKSKDLVLSYDTAGTYVIKLTAKDKAGHESTISKKVVVLDRVLKKIIIKKVFWDTIPGSIQNFNAAWPTASKADVFVRLQKYESGDSIVAYSGIMPNSAVLYQSPLLKDVNSNDIVTKIIEVPGKVIVDKRLVLSKSFVISLMAKDGDNILYALHTSWFGGSVFGIQKESLPDNKFVLVANLFSSVELECAFE